MRTIFRWLSIRVYPPFIPLPEDASSESVNEYLNDLWRDASRRVAVSQTVLVCFLILLPLLTLYRFNLFPWLTHNEKNSFLESLSCSKSYLLRLVVSALKHHALIAHLRDPGLRLALLGPRPPFRVPSPQEHRVPSVKKSGAELQHSYDYIIIGSGASGSTLAVALSEAGQNVCVVEEGGWFRQHDFKEALYDAATSLFREGGLQIARGRSLFPILEGKCVGGTTVLNGAIIHRLPRHVYEDWYAAGFMDQKISFDDLRKNAAQIEKDLHLTRNLEPILSPLPVHQALNRLGWPHQAMARFAPGCKGSGRCLQGCPTGGKLSMETSYLPRAIKAGAFILDRHRVMQVLTDRTRAAGVIALDPRGRKVRLQAVKAVILAAGAIHSPLILKRSRFKNPSIGKNLQCHLGVGAQAILPLSRLQAEGPPQGIEVHAFEQDGIRLSTQLLPPELTLARSSFVGRKLVALLKQMEHISSWTASIRAESSGRVTLGLNGQPRITLEISAADLKKMRQGIYRMAQLFFEAGSRSVFPNIARFKPELTHRKDIQNILSVNLDARLFAPAVGHIFGTCRMGSDAVPSSVVGTDFCVRGTRNLYIADASVLPNNIGVNPQLTVMCFARHAAGQILNKHA